MSEFVEVKTAELTGRALDWSVAKAIGWQMVPVPADADGANYGEVIAPPDLGDDFRFPPRGKIGPCYFLRKWSTDWAQGGPLIEQFGLDLWKHGGKFYAFHTRQHNKYCADTVLVAACLAIVAAKLGDVVQVPEELVVVK